MTCRTVTCALAECEEIFTTSHPRKRFCSRLHSNKYHGRRYYKTSKALEQKIRNKAAVRGRRCKWCRRYDDETSWSNNKAECGPCQRQKLRRPCDDCGGPFRVRRGCDHCNELTEFERLQLRRAKSVRRRGAM